jgi:hypothetical protein
MSRERADTTRTAILNEAYAGHGATALAEPEPLCCGSHTLMAHHG